jgi:hypothetical protein
MAVATGGPVERCRRASSAALSPSRFQNACGATLLGLCIDPASLFSRAPQNPNEPPKPPRQELVFGSIAGKTHLLVYSGSTYAPFGHLHESGFRVRVVGGQGRYRYAGMRYHDNADASLHTPFKGVSSFAEALVGYQFSHGNITLKVLGGANLLTNIIVPFDEYGPLPGRRQGIKGAVEFWWNATPKLWMQVDLAGSDLDLRHTALARVGYRLTPEWSVGGELQLQRTLGEQRHQAGLLARYEGKGFEVAISGGVEMDRARNMVGYATAQILMRFNPPQLTRR